MYRYMSEELASFGLPPRRIRREAYGEVDDVTAEPGFPAELASSTFTVRVHMGGSEERIPARACETVLVALERAKMAPPSQCRSGECGFCRSLLLSGDVYIWKDTDGRRAADKEFGYIHPCATYPLSNLEIRTPRAV
jgi:ferredoxin